MQIIRNFISKTYDKKVLTPEFIVIHYTACPLKEAIEILCEDKVKASSHFIISESGEIYELVPTLEEGPYVAWHAGKSLWKTKDKTYEDLNNISIGIELENLNGNIFEYSRKQYDSLIFLINTLIKKFPALNSPDKILGHEEIAGFRGKIDPGYKFDWDHLYKNIFPGKTTLKKTPALPETFLPSLIELKEKSQMEKNSWSLLNSILEKSCELIFKKKID